MTIAEKHRTKVLSFYKSKRSKDIKRINPNKLAKLDVINFPFQNKQQQKEQEIVMAFMFEISERLHNMGVYSFDWCFKSDKFFLSLMYLDNFSIGKKSRFDHIFKMNCIALEMVNKLKKAKELALAEVLKNYKAKRISLILGLPKRIGNARRR